MIAISQANVIKPGGTVVITPVPHPTTQSGVPVYTEPCPMKTGGVGYKGTHSGGFNGSYSNNIQTSSINLNRFVWSVVAEVKKVHNGKVKSKKVRS